jgi:uncharacterized protein (TIGR03435 family)
MRMQELDDHALLSEYVAHDSEEAFAALVARHVNKVYSVALRHTGNSAAAEEISQAVFVILARKSRRLGKNVNLSGWLYQTARLTTVTFVRGQIRRARREREAFMQTNLNQNESEVWKLIAPLLDEAMAALNQTDRNAVMLRFFDGKSMREVAAALGANENTARQRVGRAVEKMQNFFFKRGISSTTAIITAAISANSVQAAPVLLANIITAVAMTKGVAAGDSTLTLIKGALKFMAWTKAKTAVVVGAGILLATGTTTVAVREIREHRTYPWQVHEGMITGDQVEQPPQVRILTSKFHQPDFATVNGKLIGTGVRAQLVVAGAYNYSPPRVVFSANLPAGLYDYIACLPGGEGANQQALQAEVKRRFGVVGRVATRTADVWLLEVKSPGAPGLKLNTKAEQRSHTFLPVRGRFHGWNTGMFDLARNLEFGANIAVIDQTGLTGRFDFDLNCTENDLTDQNWDALNRALDQLGLQLVPTNLPIEMLVVEKAKD